ncbi:MAG: hypothetical protein ACR2LX_09105 [Jatrophihabitans sp.]
MIYRHLFSAELPPVELVTGVEAVIGMPATESLPGWRGLSPEQRNSPC